MKSTGLVFKSRDYIGSAEPPAIVLEDESRFGNDGAFLGDGEPDWVQLSSGLWVMSFDDTDDEVALGTDPSLYILGDITVLAWVYFTGTASNEPHIYHNGNAEAGGTLMRVGSTNKVRFLHNVGSDLYYLVELASNSITSSVWTHVVLTYEGAITTLSGYLDGVLKGTDTTTSAGTTAQVEPKIGAPASVAAVRHWGGYITLIRIYNYTFSASQIKKIFEAERHWFGV